jgi:hypothetical protein
MHIPLLLLLTAEFNGIRDSIFTVGLNLLPNVISTFSNFFLLPFSGCRFTGGTSCRLTPLCSLHVRPQVFDWLLTFDTEVKHVWNVPWNLGRILYLVTRYLVFVDASLLLYRGFYLFFLSGIERSDKNYRWSRTLSFYLDMRCSY